MRMGLRQLAGVFGIGLLGKVIAFALSVLLARRFGPEGFGLFSFALGVSQLGGRVAGLGWPTFSLRNLPVLGARSDWPALRGLLVAGDLSVFAAAVVISLALALLGAHPMSGDLGAGFMLGALLVPPMALRALCRNQLAGLGRAGRGVAVDEVIPPAVLLVLCIVAFDPRQAVFGLAGASLGAVALAYIWRRAALPAAARPVRPLMAWRAWSLAALPLLLGMSARLVMTKSDVLMLAPLASLEAVGHYGAALRLSFLQTMPVTLASAVLVPRFSDAIARGQMADLTRLYFAAMAGALVLSGLSGAGLILFGPPLLSVVFGESYVAAAPALAVLALGQIAAAAGVVSGGCLVAGGRTRCFALVTLFALAVNLAANAVLIPRLGATGAAAATAMSAALLALLQIWFCLGVLRGVPHPERTGHGLCEIPRPA